MKTQFKMKFRTKLIIMLCALFVINTICMIFVAFNVGKENSLNRMDIEFREEARTMATVWLYRSGGAFLMESGVPTTADGQNLQQNIISYFERWASLNSTKNIMTVIMKDDKGWKRICSSATDTDGNSIAGGYIEDPRIIERLETPDEVEYTGDETVGGKDYIISYSFFYKAEDTGEIPFALGIGENLADAYEEINEILFKDLLIAMIVNLFAFIWIFILIMSFVKNDITKRVLDTTTALKGAREQVAIKAEQFSLAGNYITQDSEKQIETIKEVAEKVEHVSEEYKKSYEGIVKSEKISQNLAKVVEKGDMEASSLYEKMNGIKKYIDESDEVTRRLRELRDNALSEELKYNIDKIIDIVETTDQKLDDGMQLATIVSQVMKSLLLDANSMKIASIEAKEAAEAQTQTLKNLENALVRLSDSTNEQKEKAAENIENSSSLKDEIDSVENVINDLKNI